MHNKIFTGILISVFFIFQIYGTDQESQKNNIAEINFKKGQDFLNQNKKNPGVVVRESGLQYQVLKEGKGPKPRIIDKVEVHYHGTLINGEVFDSSVERGETITFPVRGVIRGWTEALLLMNEGSKWKLFIPAQLAYGERGAGSKIGPNETLIFEVQLIRVEQ
ncbi:MAG: FKBP-type peptidyl-prolyl cis-trans isomerase [Spirochaetia bacterium]|nr:FKBP-type peptidyl-prolyl cis-trans isomerase [Spirochaetia bacterium]